MNLFDAVEADRRRDAGKAIAASARSELLEGARTMALALARRNGTVNADDVAGMMATNGFNYADLGNAAGSVFDAGFEWTGEVVRSSRPSTHGRLVRVWRLKCGT
jgi:hypothetical protein